MDIFILQLPFCTLISDLKQAMVNLSYLVARGQSPATPKPGEMLTEVFHDDSSCGCHFHCKLQDNHFIKFSNDVIFVTVHIAEQNTSTEL